MLFFGLVLGPGMAGEGGWPEGCLGTPRFRAGGKEGGGGGDGDGDGGRGRGMGDGGRGGGMGDGGRGEGWEMEGGGRDGRRREEGRDRRWREGGRDGRWREGSKDVSAELSQRSKHSCGFNYTLSTTSKENHTLKSSGAPLFH